MNKKSLYEQIINEFEGKIHFLEDKPEETIESTIKALWFASTGVYKSAQSVVNMNLPELTDQQQEKLKQLVKLRLDNVSLAYITGRQNFMGIEFLTDKRALIPRKETEILGKKALDISKEITEAIKPATIIDVCCGSGNLGLAVANYNVDTTVYLTDLSIDAVDLAKDNIKHLNLQSKVNACQGDFLSYFETEKFYQNIDLIICNPPYISTLKVSKMDNEIASNEPFLAFDGGMLGIKIIQKLVSESPRFLKSFGWLAFEVGLGQGEFVIQMLERTNHYTNISHVTDSLGNIRVISAQKK
jgi:release factor glutamine methyltransferase